MPQLSRTLVAVTIVAIALGSAGAVHAGSGKLKQIGTIANPAGPMEEFDIGFVDQKSQRYYLADRSNKSVDIFDAKSDKFIGSVGGFIGVIMKNGKPNNDVSGPDGVLIFGNEAWAGDGDSTIKVIDLKTNKVVDTVKTGGESHVDEMAYDAKDGVFIDAKNNALVQKIALKSGNPHSVAVNYANNHVFVPQSSKGGGCGCVLVFAPE
jgi:DNA-binding beta-propeller fold protein YncE